MIGIIGAMEVEVEKLRAKKWQNLKKICRSMRL